MLAQIDKPLNINFQYIYILWLSDNDKEVHTISDESEFRIANENEVNEPPNATLRDFC